MAEQSEQQTAIQRTEQTSVTELPPQNEGEIVVDYLKRLEAEGKYLFHGSARRDIDQLEPRPATDKSGDLWKNDTAVFAVTDPETAVSRAITPDRARLSGLEKWQIAMGDPENPAIPTLSVTANVAELIDHGTVYILSRSGFVSHPENGKQWKSKDVTPPLGKIEVTPADFLKLGGAIKTVN